jgi:hypothetical protein
VSTCTRAPSAAHSDVSVIARPHPLLPLFSQPTASEQRTKEKDQTLRRLQKQVATFELALKDASSEIDELRAKVSQLQREKGAAALGEYLYVHVSVCARGGACWRGRVLLLLLPALPCPDPLDHLP